MVGRDPRKAHEGIVRRSAMCKFGCCGCRFNPGFSKTEEVRVMCFNNIRQGSCVQRMKDRTDIESTQTEVAWARIELDVVSE